MGFSMSVGRKESVRKKGSARGGDRSGKGKGKASLDSGMRAVAEEDVARAS